MAVFYLRGLSTMPVRQLLEGAEVAVVVGVGIYVVRNTEDVLARVDDDGRGAGMFLEKAHYLRFS